MDVRAIFDRGTLVVDSPEGVCIPGLATTLDYRLRASLVIRGMPYRLDLDASAPIPRVHALSRRTDSAVEERLMRDLQRIGPPWSVKREAAVVRVGRRLFFPDFTLEHPEGSILVEVVGFWTEDYLDAKIRALVAMERPMIACVDVRHARMNAPALQESDSILHFKKWVDAAALIALAEKRLARARSKGVSLHDGSRHSSRWSGSS